MLILKETKLFLLIWSNGEIIIIGTTLCDFEYISCSTTPTDWLSNLRNNSVFKDVYKTKFLDSTKLTID